MTAPSRKGYRAAIEYVALQTEPTAQAAGVQFLAWFYNRDKVLVAGHVEAVQLAHDETVTNPAEPHCTAREKAVEMCNSAERRAVALFQIDKLIAVYADLPNDNRACDSVAFWQAVRRLVHHRLTWRIRP